ncbi:MAG: TolC family protein [Magnetospirillum sp.]|nr:TolC family protein [Magnetospirillum sp.]
MGLAALGLSACSMPPDLPPVHDDLASHAESLPGPVLARPLTVEDAVGLAVRFNLDARVRTMEALLAAGKADLASFALLPELSAKAGWSAKNKMKATTSQDLSTGGKGESWSRSEDPSSGTADLTASWNLIDFAIALIRSDQEAERVKLAMEKRRRALHLLVQEVYAAYWKAVINEFATSKYAGLEVQLQKSMADAETAERTKVGDPMQMLAHQRAIADTMRQIAELQRQTSTARAELAGLMGVASVSGFQLADLGDGEGWLIDEPAEDLSVLETLALANRPELRTEETQYRIDAAEVRTEILKTIPGLGPFIGGHYDSNSFLLHNMWAEAGVKVTWTIVDMLSAPQRFAHAKTTAEVTRARRMAVAMAVLTQVHVADVQYRHALKEYRLTETMANIDRRMSTLAAANRKTGGGSAIEEIKAEAARMLSTLRRYMIYSDLQAAKARMQTALGRDPVGADAAFAAAQE